MKAKDIEMRVIWVEKCPIKVNISVLGDNNAEDVGVQLMIITMKTMVIDDADNRK